jgi:hypothetical protein
MAYSIIGGTDLTQPQSPNNRFERTPGRIFGEPGREVDDWDKASSFGADATQRRSTSSLGSLQRGLSIEVDAQYCCSYNK